MKGDYKKRNSRISAQRRYGIISFVAAVFLWFLWWSITGWNMVLTFFLSVNVLTLILYAWDKSIAGSAFTRVPEVVLHSLALLGGSPAALIGQRIFRHKTQKTEFKIWQYGIIVLQLIVLFVFIYA